MLSKHLLYAKEYVCWKCSYQNVSVNAVDYLDEPYGYL